MRVAVDLVTGIQEENLQEGISSRNDPIRRDCIDGIPHSWASWHMHSTRQSRQNDMAEPAHLIIYAFHSNCLPDLHKVSASDLDLLQVPRHLIVHLRKDVRHPAHASIVMAIAVLYLLSSSPSIPSERLHQKRRILTLGVPKFEGHTTLGELVDVQRLHDSLHRSASSTSPKLSLLESFRPYAIR